MTTVADIKAWIEDGGLTDDTVVTLDGDGSLVADVPGKVAVAYLQVGTTEIGDGPDVVTQMLTTLREARYFVWLMSTVGGTEPRRVLGLIDAALVAAGDEEWVLDQPISRTEGR